MMLKKYLVLIWAILLAGSAAAGDRQHAVIKIAIADDDQGRQTFMFDSDHTGLDLQNMAVGEARTLTDASGNVATVSRTMDGFELDVAGETVALPMFDSAHDPDTFLHEDGSQGDAHAIKKIKMIKTEDDEGVTVISGVVIDEATRQKIRNVLETAGHDVEIEFIDGSEFDDGVRRHVRVIRKEVDVTR